MGFYFYTILKTFNEYILSFDQPNSTGSLRLCLRLHYEIYRQFSIFDEIFSMAETGEILASPILFLGMFLGIRLSPEITFFYTIFSVVLLQFFLMCLFGQFFYNETEMIFTNLYLTKWYEMSQSDQKAILMMMKMSKEPFGLKVLGVYEINMIMFINVLKACLSYCTILYAFM
ncbi:hypothetical protein DMENIID0001_042860 [Sergentomyia squamirostris]